MMYATNEGEEFIESVFYPNGIDHSDENRKNRVPRFLWDPMIDDIFDKGMISLRFTGNLIQSSISKYRGPVTGRFLENLSKTEHLVE